MNWHNLKKNRCPKCGKDWALDLTTVDGLLVHGCGFKIREKRYKEIVSSMIVRDTDRWLDQQERERGER
jgi:hypothetical protein